MQPHHPTLSLLHRAVPYLPPQSRSSALFVDRRRKSNLCVSCLLSVEVVGGWVCVVSDTGADVRPHKCTACTPVWQCQQMLASTRAHQGQDGQGESGLGKSSVLSPPSAHRGLNLLHVHCTSTPQESFSTKVCSRPPRAPIPNPGTTQVFGSDSHGKHMRAVICTCT